MPDTHTGLKQAELASGSIYLLIFMQVEAQTYWLD